MVECGVDHLALQFRKLAADRELDTASNWLDAREARAIGIGLGQGLAITGVDPRGPASGVIEEGDILLQLDGQPVTLDNLRAVEPRLAQGIRSILVIQRGSARFAIRL